MKKPRMTDDRCYWCGRDEQDHPWWDAKHDWECLDYRDPVDNQDEGAKRE